MSNRYSKAKLLGDIESATNMSQSEPFNQDLHPSQDSEGVMFNDSDSNSRNFLNAVDREFYLMLQHPQRTDEDLLSSFASGHRAAAKSKGGLEEEMKTFRENFRRRSKNTDRPERDVLKEIAPESQSHMEDSKTIWAFMSTLRDDVDKLQEILKGFGQGKDLWIYERKLDGIVGALDELAELGSDEKVVERSKQGVEDIKGYLRKCTNKIDMLEKELGEAKKDIYGIGKRE
ncbi:hypothetical protein SBOR_8215 [Sclerotinia borealis F-4128]|uniref:Uncharacterized protein n=1 Tax=Sclerotinia borealis (strain F-4128) TaxID=1432307 RepID=W9C6C0_SCLBF|nr:hypothetical protein SBOR_8215 [Sclerotinia borealis F-4128]